MPPNHSVPNRIVSVSQPFARPIDRDKAQDYLDECERVEAERKFSLAKRKCHMEPIPAKLRETAAHLIAMSLPALNLRKNYLIYPDKDLK